jgi:FkbM family methyltransferase
MAKIFIDCGTHIGLGFSRISEELNIDKDWKIFGFEANPFTYEQYLKNINSGNYPTLLNKNITVYNKAVWTENGKLKFSLRGISDVHYQSIYADEKDKQNPFYKKNWEPGLANLAAESHGLDMDKILEIPWDGGSCVSQIKEEMHNLNRESNFYKWHDDIEIESIDLSKWIMDNFSKEDHIVMKMDIEGSEYKVLPKMIHDGSIDYINSIYVEWHDWQMPNKHGETQLLKSIFKKKNLNIIDWH